MRPPMHNTLFTLSFGFAALIYATQNAYGQAASAPQCAPRAQVLEALATKYGEARRAIGIAGTVHVMELFVNEGTGTWTITATTPNGMMCLISSGGSFETARDPAPAKGRPA